MGGVGTDRPEGRSISTPTLSALFEHVGFRPLTLAPVTRWSSRHMAAIRSARVSTRLMLIVRPWRIPSAARHKQTMLSIVVDRQVFDARDLQIDADPLRASHHAGGCRSCSSDQIADEHLHRPGRGGGRQWRYFSTLLMNVKALQSHAIAALWGAMEGRTLGPLR